MRRNRHMLLIACLMTNIAQGQAVRNDTITDRTHQLREVTVTPCIVWLVSPCATMVGQGD